MDQNPIVFFFLLRVLILHLKRYGYDNLTEGQAKKQDKVNIERFIDLSEYLKLKYSLFKILAWEQVPTLNYVH